MKLFAITILSLVFLSGCNDAGEEEPDVRVTDKSRALIFLTHATQPPCSYINERGECVGTDIDLANKIAKRMGCELEMKVVKFEELLPSLKAGTADFAIATITITEARKRDVDFSMPYATSGNSFLYRADGPKPRMSQLATLRIAAESGTTGDIYLCLHESDPVRYSHIFEAVHALERGEVDAVFFDDMPLRAFAKQSGGKLIVSALETREGYGVAVDKRRKDILAVANEIIAEGGAK